MDANQAKIPDWEGWWARKRDGRVEWFHVETIIDAQNDPMLVIYVESIRYHQAVKDFCSPDAKWFGPIELPWEDPC